MGFRFIPKTLTHKFLGVNFLGVKYSIYIDNQGLGQLQSFTVNNFQDYLFKGLFGKLIEVKVTKKCKKRKFRDFDLNLSDKIDFQMKKS